MEEGQKGNYENHLEEDNVATKSPFEEPAASLLAQARENLTQHTQSEREPDLKCEMVSCQDLLRVTTKDRKSGM